MVKHMSAAKPRIWLFGFSLASFLSEVLPDYASRAEVRILNRLFDEAVAEARQLLSTGEADVFIAAGANGYLKKSFVIAQFEQAGFVLDGESSVNENPRDRPTEAESVWRLAPTLEAPEDPELAADYAAIGESHRMTLRFRKP